MLSAGQEYPRPESPLSDHPPEVLSAPIAAGEEVGRIVYVLEGKEIGYVPVLAENAVERMDFSTLFWRILRKMIVL